MSTSMNSFDSFTFFKLNINQRQKGTDDNFLYLINEVREHENGKKLSAKSLELLQSVLLKGGMTKENRNTIAYFVGDGNLTVFYTNKMLNVHYAQLLIKFHGIKIFDEIFVKSLQISYMKGNDQKILFSFSHLNDRDYHT